MDPCAGAFMTANLLAHAGDLFACGIARSGAFNRTLTPFGFQAEERTFWEVGCNAINMFKHSVLLNNDVIVNQAEERSFGGVGAAPLWRGRRAGGVQQGLLCAGAHAPPLCLLCKASSCPPPPPPTAAAAPRVAPARPASRPLRRTTTCRPSPTRTRSRSRCC